MLVTCLNPVSILSAYLEFMLPLALFPHSWGWTDKGYFETEQVWLIVDMLAAYFRKLVVIMLLQLPRKRTKREPVWRERYPSITFMGSTLWFDAKPLSFTWICSQLSSPHRWRVWSTCSSWENDWSNWLIRFSSSSKWERGPWLWPVGASY